MNLSAAILVGQSTRMGRDKALLMLNRRTFIEHLARELSVCEEVFISAAAPRSYSDYGLEVLVDEHQGIGPIEGIRHSLLHACSDYVFFCAVDMPFVCREMILYLSEFISSDYDAYVFCEKDKVHPLCGIYSKAALPACEELIEEGQYRMMSLLSRIRTKYVNIETSCFGPDRLRNINTPEDYQAILRPHVFCVSGVKNSGKTSLVERLIPAFTKEGLSVAVIKHDGHSFECDVEGTDSDRFYRAGAAATAVFSASQSFFRVRRQMDPDELIRQMGDVDVIIIEGLKNSSFPKVEVVRGEVSDRCVCDNRSLLCVASDTPLMESVPCQVFHLDDTEGILHCIIEKLSIRKSYP